MNTCIGDYSKHTGKGFCTKCRKALFDGRNVSSILNFDTTKSILEESFFHHIQRISISGVQTKYSLKLVQNELVLTESEGEYILKPVPKGLFLNLDTTPENEHLTMQIAKQVFKIRTAENALVRFKDAGLAYLTKRFDRQKDGLKFLQEDFAQIKQTNSQTHGENYKYEGSYEGIAALIKKYVGAYQPAIESFFGQIIFNYLFANGDAHLKNFSLLETPFKDFTLSPAYDLINTAIHSPNESAMALDLFQDDFYTEEYNILGFYSKKDFELFGSKIGIQPTRVTKIIDFFSSKSQIVELMIDSSFLTETIKNQYKAVYQNRLRGLTYKIE